ncbi:MAG: hypothetical protein WD688_13500 [Candidatus Binatia bacterium]
MAHRIDANSLRCAEEQRARRANRHCKSVRVDALEARLRHIRGVVRIAETAHKRVSQVGVGRKQFFDDSIRHEHAKFQLAGLRAEKTRWLAK